MPSLINKVLASIAYISMVSTTAVPQSSPVTSILFDKRADGTCSDIVNTFTVGNRFSILCDTDTSSNGGQQETIYTVSFADCMIQCEGPVYGSWCNFVAFPGGIHSEGPCYLKAGNGGSNLQATGVKLGARL